MTEMMLADAAAAHGLRYAALRYFNVAGADPRGRTGESTRDSTHLIKIACETALGKRPGMTVFGDDYPTPDGTCIRDYIHVSDLAAAHGDALRHLRAGGGNIVANCGYGRGFSVLEVIDTVQARVGPGLPGQAGTPPAGRPERHRRLPGADHGPARLAAEIRRSRRHRRQRAALGRGALPPQSHLIDLACRRDWG